MPKLLQIDSCLGILSTGRISEGIAKVAMAQGWDCYIAHGARYVGESIQHSYQIETKTGEYLHYAKSLLFDAHGLGSKYATKKLIRYIDEIQPDIIQMHCIHGYYINYKLLFEFLNKVNIPIVWTFHDCWAFTGHCAHYMSASCFKWRDGGCHHCPLRNEYPQSIVDCSVRNFNLKNYLFKQNRNLNIVTVSRWLECITRESFFKDKNIQTIYNGIDTNIFHPIDNTEIYNRLNAHNKKIVMAAATTWSRNKGFDDYLKLANLLPANVLILLIGLSDNQIEKLPPNVIGIKRTESAEELAAYYTIADIILNLSYQETFGLTTAEGMACGTPGIVYNITASPELITPETGIVVEPGDINGVSQGINEILGKKKNYYRDSCIERANSLYEKNKQYLKYIRLYDQLLEKNESNC